MKTIALCLFVLVGFARPVLAQAPADKFTAAMTQALATCRQARTAETFLESANQFERIATAEPDQWLPAYWSAYCFLNGFYLTKDEKLQEMALDKTETWIDKLADLQPENDEVAVLTAWYYQARLSASPATGWMRFGGKITKNIEKAKQLNPENPRAYLVEGQNAYYTPTTFGGGKQVALPLFKTSQEKFAKFTAPSPLHPDWGQFLLARYIKSCEAAAN
ncbi:MAG: hypothetical protein MUC97_14810 [Bernardetiaceae bacterium]|jgi:hypothetical protein|nr:hypothetical protein [Bernardetiaceae bacterium]